MSVFGDPLNKGTRERARGAGTCERHSGPLIADRAEGGSVVVRCLVCGTVGPVRETTAEAYRALRDSGK
jgi:hypothetical protein